LGDRKSNSTRFDERTLTAYEKVALDSPINLSDGHAHQLPSPVQAKFIAQMCDLFADSGRQTQADAQRRFLTSFFDFAAGTSVSTQIIDRALICYSASMACEVLANMFRAERRRTLHVIEPTFDNIPSILRRHEIDLVSVPESDLDSEIPLSMVPDGGTLFLVTPNNPTGKCLNYNWWRGATSEAARRSITLVFDCAFRLFDESMRWNQYDLLDRSGASFMVIEDMGKCWPSQDLKVGLLVSSPDLYPALERIHDDFLLNVSPFVLNFLTGFLSISAEQGSHSVDIQELARMNRGILQSHFLSAPVRFMDQCPTMGVSWLELDAELPSASVVCERLAARGVHVLPGRPFYWSRPALGDRFIRVALMRAPEAVEAGAEIMQRVLSEFPSSRTT
jgi:aspartate/methionine/tyrosine aminotransferase